MTFTKTISLDREQTSKLWGGSHTYVTVGFHDDGTPAFAKIEAPAFYEMLKEASDILDGKGGLEMKRD